MSEPRWLVVRVKAPPDADRPALVEGLLALGSSAVQEADDALITYFKAPAALDDWIEFARLALGTDFEWRWQADEDWSEEWKRGLKARRVGHNFIVTPSWDTPDADAEDRVIVIDPEMAFGTGEHATTRGVLRFLEQVGRAGDRVLDVGTGSAILAIGAAMLGADEVIAVDNDSDAILNARDNVKRNVFNDAVQLQIGLVDAVYLSRLGPARFDVIVANVLSSVLKPLLTGFFESVSPGGHVILGGILQAEADDMLAACRAAGFNVLAEDLEEEWWGVLLQRPALTAS